MLRALPVAVFALLLSTSLVPGDASTDKPAPEVDVRFLDGSAARVVIVQSALELETKYGKLTIPCPDVRKIDLGFRAEEGAAEKIAAAIKQLSSDNFQQREAASKELLRLAVAAYPVLKANLANKDIEVVRRCEAMIAQLEKAVPADRLKVRHDDLVQTKEFAINGRLTAEKLRVRSKYFGESDLRLADLRSVLATAGAFDVTAPFADKAGLFKAAHLFELGDHVGAKWEAAQFAKGKSVEDLAGHFRLRSRGGLGVGLKPNLFQPDGIEHFLMGLESNGNTSARLLQAANAHPDELARSLYIVAAIGEAHRHHCPVKEKKGKQDPKDWERWSVSLRDNALEMTKAVQAKELPKVRELGMKVNRVCIDCHDVFRNCN
jgi:hypothetical protein